MKGQRFELQAVFYLTYSMLSNATGHGLSHI